MSSAVKTGLQNRGVWFKSTRRLLLRERPARRAERRPSIVPGNSL